MIAVIAGSAMFGRQADLRSILLVASLVGGLVLVRVPALRLPMLLIIAAFVPFEIGTGTGSSVNAAMLMIVLLSAMWFLEAWSRREAILPTSVANAPWLVLLSLAALSMLAGRAGWNPLVIVKSSFNMVQLGQLAVFALSSAAFWLLGRWNDRRQLKLLTWLLLGLAAYWLAVRLVPPLGRYAPHLSFDAAMFRVWAIALAGAFFLYWPQLHWIVRWSLGALALGLVAYPLLAAYGWAGGWLPGIVVLAVFAWHVIWRRFPPAGVVALLAAIYGAIWLLERTTSDEVWSVDTRVIAWTGLLQLLKGHWLLGLGLASYWHYWRGVFGVMAYRDVNGYQHMTIIPKVNMHNNYFDVLGQMGILGILAMLWLMISLAYLAIRVARAEPSGFGKAYAMACLAALAGMAVAGMMGDWLFPFVYNIGLNGFRESFLGWMFLGGLVVLQRTRAEQPPNSPAVTKPFAAVPLDKSSSLVANQPVAP